MPVQLLAGKQLTKKVSGFQITTPGRAAVTTYLKFFILIDSNVISMFHR